MAEKIKYATRRIGRAIRSATGLTLPTAMRLGKMCAQKRIQADFRSFAEVSFRTHQTDIEGRWVQMWAEGPRGAYNLTW